MLNEDQRLGCSPAGLVRLVVGVTRANLISQLPKWADDETHKPGR